MTNATITNTNTTTMTATTTQVTTTTVTANYEVTFAVNGSSTPIEVRDAVAASLGVSTSTIAIVANTTTTVVLGFQSSADGQAAITKANDGALSSVGITGASAMATTSSPSSDDDDGSNTTAIVIVVVVVGVILIGALAFGLVKACGRASSKGFKDEEMESNTARLDLPNHELV